MTRGSSKANELLNENLYNKIFKGDFIPNEEVILIYKIYFQLIARNDITIANIHEFWKSCCQYFISEGKGKTGKHTH